VYIYKQEAQLFYSLEAGIPKSVANEVIDKIKKLQNVEN
jgi:hypothetical protein